MVDEEGDVLLHLSKRRHGDVHHVQAADQILANFARPDLGFKIPVGGSDDPGLILMVRFWSRDWISFSCKTRSSLVWTTDGNGPVEFPDPSQKLQAVQIGPVIPQQVEGQAAGTGSADRTAGFLADNRLETIKTCLCGGLGSVMLSLVIGGSFPVIQMLRLTFSAGIGFGVRSRLAY